MRETSIAVKKKKSLKSSVVRKRAVPPFADKISFIRSLILDSVEPGTIKKIYLFGSYAYGKPTRKSDIDLCVVIGDDQNDSKTYLDIARNLFLNNIIPADILLYKENEFSEFSKLDGVENLIFTKGKVLYG